MDGVEAGDKTGFHVKPPRDQCIEYPYGYARHLFDALTNKQVDFIVIKSVLRYPLSYFIGKGLSGANDQQRSLDARTYAMYAVLQAAWDHR